MTIITEATFRYAKQTKFQEHETARYREYRKEWEQRPKERRADKFPVHLDLELANDCCYRCKYCHGKGTPILMADLSWKFIEDVKIGDVVIGVFKEKNKRIKFIKTKVMNVMSRYAECVELAFDNMKTICSSDHKWLTVYHGYQQIKNSNLITNRIRFVSFPIDKFIEDADYKYGWTVGMLLGDASIKIYDYSDRIKANFRLAVIDKEIIDRFKRYNPNFNFHDFIFKGGKSKLVKKISYLPAIRLQAINDVRHLIKIRDSWKNTDSFKRGFLAGIFDAEGSYSDVIRISNYNHNVIIKIKSALEDLGFKLRVEAKGVRLLGGTGEIIKFFAMMNPGVLRKREYLFKKSLHGNLGVKSVKSVGMREVYNFTTEIGNYVASGLVSKNCFQSFARDKIAPFGLMDFGLYKRLIDEGVKKGLYSIKLCFRGEPLLHPQIAEMVKYAKDKGVLEVLMNSNCALLTENMSKKLIEAGLDKLMCSVDGCTAEVYESVRIGGKFENVLNNIKKMQELKKKMGKKFPIVRVQVVDSPSTHDQLKEYFDFWGKIADDIGVENVNDWTYKDLDKVIVCPTFECAMLYQRLIIGWDGRVFICCGNHFGKFIAGDVNKQTVEEIWNGDAMRKLREYSECGKLHKSCICAECGYRKTCIGLYKLPFTIEKNDGYDF